MFKDKEARKMIEELWQASQVNWDSFWTGFGLDSYGKGVRGQKVYNTSKIPNVFNMNKAISTISGSHGQKISDLQKFMVEIYGRLEALEKFLSIKFVKETFNKNPSGYKSVEQTVPTSSNLGVTKKRKVGRPKKVKQNPF